MDDYDIIDEACPKCGHNPTHVRGCLVVGCEDGMINLYDEDPIFFAPGEYQPCRECHGTGVDWWCPECGADCEIEERRKSARPDRKGGEEWFSLECVGLVPRGDIRSVSAASLPVRECLPMNKIETIRKIWAMATKHCRVCPYTGHNPDELGLLIAEYYTSTAGQKYYDFLGDSKNSWENMSARDRFIEIVESSWRIADCGCGAGGLASEIASRYPEKWMYAMDISGHAFSKLFERTQKVVWNKASVLSLPYGDESMDMIISRFVIEHVVDPRRLISEAFRVLRPGGVLYMTYAQLLLKVKLSVAIREIILSIVKPDHITHLMPQIDDETMGNSDRDAVYLSTPWSITRMLTQAGFTVELSRWSQSLVIARKVESLPQTTNKVVDRDS